MDKRHKQNPTYYPLFLDLRDKPVVVVGGGKVAERKVRALLKCDAKIRLISPKITPGLKKISRQKKIQWHPRLFKKGDLKGSYLVFAATDHLKVNRLIAEQAGRTRQMVNVANLPEACSFLVPAVVRRGGLMITVSTSGQSPGLAKKICRDLERAYGREFSDFIEILGKVRRQLTGRIPHQGRRQKIFDRLVRSEVLDLLRAGRHKTARQRIREITGLSEKDF